MNRKFTVILTAVVLLLGVVGSAGAQGVTPQTLLPGALIPKFVDPLHGDYHLRFGSAAINRGVDAGVTTDLDGNPRPYGAGFDIGAYEFVVAPTSGTYSSIPVAIVTAQ